MGYGPFFAAQAPQPGPLAAYRISEVHRASLTGIAPSGARMLTTAADLETGAFAVGDWVLANAAGQVETLLERQSLLHRRAAGSDARQQLIAANCDTLFITSSCNADFNPARLERFLVLAYEGGVFPVIVLTKADMAEAPGNWEAQAQKLDPRVPVLAINALDPADLEKVGGWCKPGKTAALVGSSGVGKTTLTNGLCARTDATGAIREDDARGRHVTTSRTLRPMTNGGWIIDTPGMRALRLEDVGDGLEAMFDDISKLALTCKFTDCAHDSEPGCAVRAAIEGGTLEADRVTRWEKLRREDRRNTETLAQSRARNRAQTKIYRNGAKKAEFRKRF